LAGLGLTIHMQPVSRANAGSRFPLVSVLIPCYNAEKWIRESIQSALDQSYPNKEVIVADDGSTDGSAGVIRSFGDRIRFHLSSHAGGNATRNALTQLARGGWLQYLDADDYLLPRKIESQMASVQQVDPAVVYSPVIRFDQTANQLDELGKLEDDEYLALIRWGGINTGGLLLRRDAVLDVGGWNPGQKCCQEHELLLRLRLAENRFHLQDEALAVYRIHSSATVSREDPLLTIRTRMELTDRLADHLESLGEMTRIRKDALFAARMECARTAFGLDPNAAKGFSQKACALGRIWVTDSPALPFGYQLALRVAGFANAERLAKLLRR